MTLRNIVAAVAGSIAISGAAADLRAADLRLEPVKSAPAVVMSVGATGPYVGLSVGYGWGTAAATAAFDPVTGFFYNFGGDPYSFDAPGFFGAATLGYNWRRNAIVVGVEGEIGYLGLEGSRIDPNGVAAGFPDTTTSFKSDFFGALTARLGFAMGSLLLYAKGGVALLNARATTVDPCIAPPAGCGTEMLTMTGDKIMTGWSLGGGGEWAFAPSWSVKAEYAYFDFGTVDTTGVSSAGDRYFQTVGVTVHTAKLGVNYRFGAASGR